MKMAPSASPAGTQIDRIACADCTEFLPAYDGPRPNLIFADPPFNIGYQYDRYHDKRPYEEYYAWTEKWMKACADALHPAGSFYVAIGDEYAAEVCTIGKRQLGLTLRNWIIWQYTFGQATQAKFARAHAHIFYFVKDPKAFTFNDAAVRVASDRADALQRQAGQCDRQDAPTTSGRFAGTVPARKRSLPATRAATCGWRRGSAARSRNACSGIPARCPRRCSTGSSGRPATSATWCSTRSPAPARRWSSPSGWAGTGSALTSARTT